VRLEGTLDAFSLPDIFQLLSYTKKTGTLHLRREGQHGVVHLRDGAVTGGRGNAAGQALGRRLVGAGLVDDDALADAVEKVLDEPGSGLAKALADTGKLDTESLRALAAEQATDAVFELLRWPDGDFAFVVDETNPDDLGASLPVEEVVAEGRRRLETWSLLTEKVPSASAVVSLAAAPAGELVLSREEWALLSLVDGSRSVAELVTLAGRGEYVVVSALSGLAERGLLVVGERPEGVSALAQRQQLLAALEGRVVAAPAVPAAREVAEEPAPAVERKAVIPERPEPFSPERQPEFAEEPVPALARMAANSARTAAASAAASAPAASASAPVPSAPAASVGAVQGAHALQPDAAPAPSSYIDRDPSVNKSLLLRLIAGVRGL
jgi:hypothetical protein